jgi:hypothetical protein
MRTEFIKEDLVAERPVGRDGIVERRRKRVLGRRSSNPNITALATFMARVEYAARLNEQQLDLRFGIRLVLDALWDDEHLACRDMNRATGLRNAHSITSSARASSLPGKWLASISR